MKDLTGTMCARVWDNFDIDAKGAIRPCCEFEGLLADQNQKECNVTTHSIEEIINCEDLKKLRSDMLNGRRPTACNKCWSVEDAGHKQSLRQHSNKNSLLDSRQLSVHAMSLQNLGIALGNICNLKCRICGPWASSLWASDEIRRLGNTVAVWEKDLLKKGAWPQKATDFWQDLKHHCSNIRTINFYGGEPFINIHHLEILNESIKDTQWKDISVYYATNGTVFPAKHLDILRKFRQVNIRISIDDVGQRFEYQRKNARWNEVVQNVDLFRTVPEFNLIIACTVSVFNALYIDEILHDFQARWPDLKCDLQVVRLAHYHSILYAPVDFKRTVERRLDISKFSTETQHQLQAIVSLMQAHDSQPTYWEELRENILQIDKFRKETLRLTHKELADFLNL